MPPMRWTPKQIAVLRVLADADAPLCGADIARQLDVNRGHVYPILHRMRETGLIVGNRRRGFPVYCLYEITATGVAVVKAIDNKESE